MSELQRTGGARLSWVETPFPFARLTASDQELSLSAWLLGAYTFSPSDVASLEPYSFFGLSRGVKILHTNAKYPEKVIFRGFGGPERLIQEIHDVGFRPSALLTSIPRRSGIPLRWSFIVAFLLIWNGLFILDGSVPWKEFKPPGVYTLLALVFLFLTSVALDRSAAFQSIATKPGRFASEVRPVLLLTRFVSVVLLIFLTAFYLAG